MGHVHPPEDPRSAASTFAPHMPGAAVVSDDADAKGQNPGGAPTASDASEQYADEALPNAGNVGPDRGPNYVPVGERSREQQLAAASMDQGVPRGEGRKGEATRKAQEEQQKKAAEREAERESPLKSSDDDSKSSSKSSSSSSSKSK